MPPAWAPRQAAIRRDGLVSPAVFSPMGARLGAFVGPEPPALEAEAGPPQVPRSLAGLLAHLNRKKAETIAALGDGERQVLQDFIGTAPWDHRPFIPVLVGQVAERLGAPEGVIACAPSRVPQRGPSSVGGTRPWGSHRGQGDTCQGGVCMGYASRHDHAVLACRLSRPKDGAHDKQRRAAGPVPPAGREQPRHEPCVERRALGGAPGPPGGVTGADVLGRHTGVRQAGRERGARSVLGGPCNTRSRAREAPWPASHGRGRRPHAPGHSGRGVAPSARPVGLETPDRAPWGERPRGTREGETPRANASRADTDGP